MSQRPEHRSLLDAATIARFGAMDVRARAVVEGFVAGLHKSPYKGFSVEFAEHRQYMPGDPVKSVDWKVYGQVGSLLREGVREETNLRAYLVIDGSASMGYSSDGVTKFDYARYLSAATLLSHDPAAGLRRGAPVRSGDPPVHPAAIGG